MAHEPGPPAGRERGRWRDRRWQPVALAAAVILTGATIYLAASHYHVPEERRELYHYFKGTFPRLHDQAESIEAAIVRLYGEGAPSTEGAVEILDHNTLPSIDFLLEQARAIRMVGIDARALHAGYVQALEAMKADVQAMRTALADTSVPAADRRRRVYELSTAVDARFDAFFARAIEVCRVNGIDVKP